MENTISNEDVLSTEKISISEEYEIMDWSKKFGITPDKLKRVVIEVGTKTKKIEQFLRTSSNN